MKCKQVFSFVLLISVLSTAAQSQHPFFKPKGLPINVTFFTESIGLPNPARFFKQSGYGIRVGTELYYSNRSRSQFFQTVNLGFYNHRNFASAFFISSEAGYRRYFGSLFADATIGGGVQFSNSALLVYKPSGNGYEKVNGALVRFIPVIGLGMGYRFQKASVFTRYELFGEMPFGYQGIPALPHQAFHLGTQVRF